jgi:hypothetical protein
MYCSIFFLLKFFEIFRDIHHILIMMDSGSTVQSSLFWCRNDDENFARTKHIAQQHTRTQIRIDLHHLFHFISREKWKWNKSITPPSICNWDFFIFFAFFLLYSELHNVLCFWSFSFLFVRHCSLVFYLHVFLFLKS